MKTEQDGLVRHRQTKGPETDRPHLNHRVTPRLHLVGTVALVGGFQIWAAALVQLRRIGLHPAPDAAGVHFDAAFRQKFSDMFVAQGKVPADAQRESPCPGNGVL